MTDHISNNKKATRIADCLDKFGPLSKVDIVIKTGLTPDQFKSGWHTLKRNLAPILEKVAVYDGVTNVYGLWTKEDEGIRGTMQRIEDGLTRLVTIERGSIAPALALTLITPRQARAIEMLLQEHEEQRKNIAIELGVV